MATPAPNPLNNDARADLAALITWLRFEPARYKQDTVAVPIEAPPMDGVPAPACETACCLAGFTAERLPDFKEFGWYHSHFDNVFVTLDYIDTRGERKNVIKTVADRWNIDCHSRLFSGDPDRDWPAPYAERWDSTTNRLERALVAIDALTAILAANDWGLFGQEPEEWDPFAE